MSGRPVWPADRGMEPWIPILWFLYHLAVIAYFQWRLHGEELDRNENGKRDGIGCWRSASSDSRTPETAR